MNQPPESAYQRVAELVARYREHRTAYESPSYNEETARSEFITPFFQALGWDVTNVAGIAEPYKDVIHEEGIRIGDSTKAPDYTFRAGAARQFFVEAKKPSISLKDDPSAALQLRRYAFSAHLPLSILTDFEEFVVYDTRIRPREGDQPRVARLLYLTFDDYASRFGDIWSLFSKEAVIGGSLERYAAEAKQKRGTTTVDAEFLSEIEGWRDELARNIAVRNVSVSADELNFAVQAIINRIVFLRIAEGRGVELYGTLLALCNGTATYGRLVELFRRADAKYNSGLFDFSADTLTPSLTIDDRVLKAIFQNLYYPKSPYEFSVLPIELLGSVYEQFLGKVIRLTPGHRAVVEERPAVKKAGGVYYTPRPIVDYIVRATLTPLCAGKTPKQLEMLRVVDPACGSGSFLLGAYAFLLEQQLLYYMSHSPEKHPTHVYQHRGSFRLTTAAKRRILVNCIFGVDTDRQAVEVTKLSLLLKVMEDETQDTLARQLSIFGERALPSLEANIKCGNSLLGPEHMMQELFGSEAVLQRMNAFDWRAEFPRTMSAGGFDAVVGNPPYIRIQVLNDWAPEEVLAYRNQYASAQVGSADIYVMFVERGLALLKKTGQLGMIVPSKFFTTDYGLPLRKLISEGRRLRRIVDFGHEQVFANATTYTCLLFLKKEGAAAIEYVETKPSGISRLADTFRVVPSDAISERPWTFADAHEQALTNKLLASGVALRELVTGIARGSSTGADDVFILRRSGSDLVDSAGNRVTIEPALLRTPIYASDFGRYQFSPAGQDAVVFPYEHHDGAYELVSESRLREQYPAAFSYLSSKRKLLMERKQFRVWYGFSAARSLAVHGSADILIPLLANKGLFCRFDKSADTYCLMASGGFSVTLRDDAPVAPEYVLALLNSSPLFWRLRAMSNKFRGGWITCTKQYFETLPIHLPDLATAGGRKFHDDVVALAEQRMKVGRALQQVRMPAERARLLRDVERLDSRLDEEASRAYGLSPDDVLVAKQSAAPAADEAHADAADAD